MSGPNVPDRKRRVDPEPDHPVVHEPDQFPQPGPVFPNLNVRGPHPIHLRHHPGLRSDRGVPPTLNHSPQNKRPISVKHSVVPRERTRIGGHKLRPRHLLSLTRHQRVHPHPTSSRNLHRNPTHSPSRPSNQEPLPSPDLQPVKRLQRREPGQRQRRRLHQTHRLRRPHHRPNRQHHNIRPSPAPGPKLMRHGDHALSHRQLTADDHPSKVPPKRDRRVDPENPLPSLVINRVDAGSNHPDQDLASPNHRLRHINNPQNLRPTSPIHPNSTHNVPQPR